METRFGSGTLKYKSCSCINILSKGPQKRAFFIDFENPVNVNSFSTPKLTIMNTDFLSHVNWLAVLVAGAAYFILGGLWYSKALFGSKWAQLVKLDVNDPNLKKGMGGMMLSTLVLILIVCFSLEVLIIKFGFEQELIYGIKLGLLTGLGFATAAVSINYVYERRPGTLYLINNGYHVLGHVLAASILVLWR